MIQDIIRGYYHNFVDTIKYKIFRKYHIVDTGLEPGYADVDLRMLHANFNLLKNFVEEECASMWHICNEEPLPWWKTYFTSYRSPENGIKWLSEKTNPQDEEILKLYKWWVEERPNRVDPFTLYWETQKNLPLITETVENESRTRRLSKEEKKAIKAFAKAEEDFLKEDQNMLIRLMKVRICLWT